MTGITKINRTTIEDYGRRISLRSIGMTGMTRIPEITRIPGTTGMTGMTRED